MGRRAVHLTTAERTAAQREHDRRYSKSAPAKNIRATAKRLQQRRKVAKNPAPASFDHIPQLPPLSEAILVLNDIALPEEQYLYREALNTPDSLDLSDLGRWKRQPPFEEDEDPTDPHSEAYLRYTQNLSFVLHGDRMRTQNELDIQRREDFEGTGGRAAIRRLREEVLQLLEYWDRVRKLQNFYHPFHQSREHEMLNHYTQWLARTIYHLYYLKFLN